MPAGRRRVEAGLGRLGRQEPGEPAHPRPELATGIGVLRPHRLVDREPCADERERREERDQRQRHVRGREEVDSGRHQHTGDAGHGQQPADDPGPRRLEVRRTRLGHRPTHARQRGADGEDPTLINPLIDDSIAALDDEIGNLSMRNYNHNDLEDFLGKIAAPDDYIVADSTLAKRADELIGSIEDDAVVWGVDPEAWLRETGRSGGPEDVRGLLEGLDMGAASPVSEAEGILKGTTRSILPDLKAAREGGLTRGTGETVSKTGTPGYQAVDAKGKPIGRRQKLKESDQGNDLRTYNEKLLMPDRVRQANKRATKMNPDALQINPSSDISQKEIRKLIENASRDYPDVWNEFGLGGFDLSHITPLEKGGKNAWANIKLMPTEANLDQGVLPFSVWRYLSDTEKLKQLGGGGFGLGKYAEGQ